MKGFARGGALLGLALAQAYAAAPLRKTVVVVADGRMPTTPTHSDIPVAMLQTSEGVRLVGSAGQEPPSALFLPANELAPLPLPAVRSSGGERTSLVDPGLPAVPDYCRTQECKEWPAKSAARYRRLAELVSRRYERKGDKYVETLATGAARFLTEADRKLLPPSSLALNWSPTGFEVLIPWEAMPPQSQLRMEQFSLEVLDSRRQRRWPLRVLLANPRVFFFAPCHLPLVATIERFNTPYRDFQPGFYVPQPGDQLERIYAWEDAWDGWEWTQVPPLLHTSEATYTQLGPAEWICGPILTYRRAEGYSIRDDRLADLSGFDVARLADPSDGYLALSRPRLHPYAAQGMGGPCAGDVTVSWKILHILPASRRIRVVAAQSRRTRCTLDEPWDYEVSVSDDLQTVTEYEGMRRKDDLAASQSLVWRKRLITWREGQFFAGAWTRSPAPAKSTSNRKQDRWR